MPTYLTFALAAPIGAMGELAVGERRSSWDRPGRSAVLGLIAGCLGLDRTDEAAHRELELGYGLAMRIGRCGPLMADYHTAQVPPRRRNRRFATRAEELEADDLETILSRRDYRVDMLVLCAIWARVVARWPLEALSDALKTPRFVPYFGRKACPLGLPMKPILVEHNDPVAALAARAADGPERAFITSGRGPIVVLDRADLPAGIHASRIELRRDALVNRTRWQFALREEAVIALEDPS